jgi:hypothetical protein
MVQGKDVDSTITVEPGKITVLYRVVPAVRLNDTRAARHAR